MNTTEVPLEIRATWTPEQALEYCLATDCQYTVDGISGFRGVLWLADAMAREDKSCVRDGKRKIIDDYRSNK